MKAVMGILVVVGTCLLLAVAPGSRTVAQIDAIERLALQLNNNLITLYNVDEAGSFTLLETLPGFRLRDFLTSTDFPEWLIMLPSDIAVSPNGQHFAFVAIPNRQDGPYGISLFVYTLGETGLHRVDAPGLATLKWSPDSEAILLVPPEIYTGSPWDKLVHDAYLYDLATDEFHNLTNSPDEGKYNFLWSPDGEHILFVGPYLFCDPSCLSARNIHVIDRSGQQQTQLTDLNTQVPLDIDLSPYIADCIPAYSSDWSVTDGRLYYDVHCYTGEFPHVAGLYSVTVTGDNRFELDLTSFFSENHPSQILGLYVDSATNDVYLVVDGRREDLVHFWRVLRISQSGQVDTVAVVDFDAPFGLLSTTTISPDEQQIAISGHIGAGGGVYTGYLALVELDTGQTTTYETSHAICELQWLDDHQLRYTEFEYNCNNAFRRPEGTWELNVTTGAVEEITSDLEGYVWLLPLPE